MPVSQVQKLKERYEKLKQRNFGNARGAEVSDYRADKEERVHLEHHHQKASTRYQKLQYFGPKLRRRARTLHHKPERWDALIGDEERGSHIFKATPIELLTNLGSGEQNEDDSEDLALV